MLIGYARVSTIHQNLDRQIAALGEAGCEKIFSDKASGKSLHARPQLEKAIEALSKDDVLVVSEWDRATRSMLDGITIIQRIASKGALLKALDKNYLDLTTPLGRGVLSLLSAIAEDERERIVRRAADGRIQAKKNGVKFGPKFKITDEQREHALQMMAEGKSQRFIAQITGVSPSTICRLK